MGAKRDFALIGHGHSFADLDDVDVAGVVDNSLLQYDSTSGTWQDVTLAGLNAQLDHGTLAGLSDDDHPQYAAIAQAETITETWTWTDNDEIRLGTGGDLRLYHDGTDSFIDNDTGLLKIFSPVAAQMFTNFFQFIGDDPELYWKDNTGGTNTKTWAITATNDALNFRPRADNDTAGSTFLQFTRSGNTVPAVRISLDNVELQIGAGSDLRLYHNGTNSILENDTGELFINSTTAITLELSTGADLCRLTSSLSNFGNTGVSDYEVRSTSSTGSVSLRTDTNPRVTATNGTVICKVQVISTGGLFGTESNHPLGLRTNNTERVVISADGTTVSLDADNRELRLGAGNDLRLYHDGTNSLVRNDTGELRLQFSTTVGVAVETTGAFDMRQQIQRSNVISPAQLTANTDNWNPTGLSTASTIRLSTDASRNITGIVAQADGTEITLCNVGAQDAVLVHDATSTAANRFLCPGSANFTLNANDSVRIWYDTTSSRWRVVES